MQIAGPFFRYRGQYGGITWGGVRLGKESEDDHNGKRPDEHGVRSGR